jgi:hypothetical protein
MIQRVTSSKPVEYGHFGYSVSISPETVLVGSLNETGPGSVTVFSKPSDAHPDIMWSKGNYLEPLNEIPGDMYGSSVSVYGKTIAVGACKTSSAWQEEDDGNSNLQYNGAVHIYTSLSRKTMDSSDLHAFNAHDSNFGAILLLCGISGILIALVGALYIMVKVKSGVWSDFFMNESTSSNNDMDSSTASDIALVSSSTHSTSLK